MVARNRLAVTDHNSNTGRKQATVTRGKNKGDMKYKSVFPKGQKKWVAKPVKTRKSYSFVEGLMEAVFLFEAKKPDVDDRDTTDDEDNTITP